MSHITLNVVDSEKTLTGTIHASIADFCVAALAAEPETIGELELALTRFQKEPVEIRSVLRLHEGFSIDAQPFDAGVMIVDLAARMVMCDSTYSQPGPAGAVEYQDGTATSDCPIRYMLDVNEWLFVDSIDEYLDQCKSRRQTRNANPPLDARPILYGRTLSEFIARAITCATREGSCSSQTAVATEVEPVRPKADTGLCGEIDRMSHSHEVEAAIDELESFSGSIIAIHRDWLMTPREDLQGKSPREVMLAKQNLINFDLDSRAMQWSILLEGPPCLDRNSFAYRFAGFGIHEWVIYYDLVRFLISNGVLLSQELVLSDRAPDLETLIIKLEELKLKWLAEPNDELGEHVPFIVLDNERKRLPEAMGGRSMVIDEECPICKMMGDEAEAGLGIFFWHLDGSNMEQEFAFSTCRTMEEWEAEQHMYDEVAKRCTESEARRERGELVEDDLTFEALRLDEFVPWRQFEEEPPEA